MVFYRLPLSLQLTLRSGTRRLNLRVPQWLNKADRVLHPTVSWWRHRMMTFSALLALCEGNPTITGGFPHKGQWRGALMLSLISARTPVTGEFPAQRASNAENVSVWWRHHVPFAVEWHWSMMWWMLLKNIENTFWKKHIKFSLHCIFFHNSQIIISVLCTHHFVI